MRFKFVLTVNRQKSPLPILPVQYQYPFSCWIYKLIKTGNPEYRGWLQRHNFVTPRQVFSDFTFSNLLLNKRDYEIKSDRLMLLTDEVEMVFSFRTSVDAEEYVNAVFRNQQFSIGDKKSRVFFKITSIKKLPLKDISNCMRFKTISPLLVCHKSEEEGKVPEMIEPGDEAYAKLLLQELLHNYRHSTKKHFDEDLPEKAELKVLNEPRARLVVLKAGTPDAQRVKGFHMEFEISTDPAYLEYGYMTGFGSLNKTGFGCVEIIEEEEQDRLYER